MNAAAIAMIINAALRIIQGLRDAFGASKEQIADLLALAIEENRDVSAGEIETLIGEAQSAIDRLREAARVNSGK